MSYRFFPYQNPGCQVNKIHETGVGLLFISRRIISILRALILQDVGEFLKLCIQMARDNIMANDDEINKLVIMNMIRKNEHAHIIKQIIDEEISLNVRRYRNNKPIRPHNFVMGLVINSLHGTIVS